MEEAAYVLAYIRVVKQQELTWTDHGLVTQK